tara:strand:+ start:5484 stop:5669 length:186 start_codon:yes stop_codon:yes gene_type:complete
VVRKKSFVDGHGRYMEGDILVQSLLYAAKRWFVYVVAGPSIPLTPHGDDRADSPALSYVTS